MLIEERYTTLLMNIVASVGDKIDGPKLQKTLEEIQYRYLYKGRDFKHKKAKESLASYRAMNEAKKIIKEK